MRCPEELNSGEQPKSYEVLREQIQEGLDRIYRQYSYISEIYPNQWVLDLAEFVNKLPPEMQQEMNRVLDAASSKLNENKSPGITEWPSFLNADLQDEGSIPNILKSMVDAKDLGLLDELYKYVYQRTEDYFLGPNTYFLADLSRISDFVLRRFSGITYPDPNLISEHYQTLNDLVNRWVSYCNYLFENIKSDIYDVRNEIDVMYDIKKEELS